MLDEPSPQQVACPVLLTDATARYSSSRRQSWYTSHIRCASAANRLL